MLQLLQYRYFYNIQCGLAGIGQYNLLDMFSCIKIPKDEIVIPGKLLEPGEIIDYVRGTLENLESLCKCFCNIQ